MEQMLSHLVDHWFGLFLCGMAVVCGAALAWGRWRGRRWSLGLCLLCSTFLLSGLGGLTLFWLWGLLLVVAAVAVLFVMFLVVVVTGRWWAPLGYAMGAVLVAGLGGSVTAVASQALAEAGRTLLSLEVVEPWWLLLLGLVPAVFWFSFRSLAGLGPVRRWLAIGLRCGIIVLLTLALADVRLKKTSENVTVLFLVDRSLSVPGEYDPTAQADSPQGRVDHRWERIKKFINEAVEKRGPGRERDKAGVIVFGRRPRLELPPSDAPQFNFTEVASPIDSNYTDISAAIKLALASFPEGTGKRMVLISDGNENLGNAEEQARIARHNGAQIDIVPLASGQRHENEVLVQAVEAPPLTEQGARLPIRVLLRSYNPKPVHGMLTLRQISEGQSVIVGGGPVLVRLRPGLNSFSFQQDLARLPKGKNGAQGSFTYEATFEPRGIEVEEGQIALGLPGDRLQNNQATTHVLALGQRRILVIEPTKGEHNFLIQHLEGLGEGTNRKYRVHTVTVDQLPQRKADLAVFLSNYDCVILANVPASDIEAGDVGGERVAASITDEQQEVLRSNTYDQGCGLIMIGGPNSFGAGGWQGTPVEKALPVDCDIKSLKVQGKGGLVLIMHASEMARGNYWQKEIAKLAIKKLSPMDMVGVLYYDWGKTIWHIDFQAIADKRDLMLQRVDKMAPGDMPEFDTALQMAYDALTKPEHELATKHIIIISDGDPMQQNKLLLSQMRSNRVTCTTVGVATHGAPFDRNLSTIATATRGRFYNVKSANALPAIYIKETRLVSQSFIYENRRGFPARLHFKSGPTDGLPDNLPPLYGMVRTTLKQSPLVEMPIEGPPSGEQTFPLLAYWHYGLGKAVAFTSDARSQPDKPAWDKDWAGSEVYLKFWEQVVDWSLRAVETGRLTMHSEYRDGKVRVIVDARDEDNKPLSNLRIRGAVTPPNPNADSKIHIEFREKSSGVYEAEFRAEEAGSYFITAQPTRKVKSKDKDGNPIDIDEGFDSVRAGVTIPYSPEFADFESNTGLLEKLRDMTGGQAYPDDAEALAQAALTGQVFRRGLPLSKSLQAIWYWLVLLAAVLLFFDVATRRIAIEPLAVAAGAQKFWAQLRRRRGPAVETPQFIERLKSRKAQIDESLDRTRATRRFDAGESAPAAPAPAGAGDAPAPSRPLPPQPAPKIEAGPEKEPEPADFASRLMKAKKKVWEERDKPK